MRPVERSQKLIGIVVSVYGQGSHLNAGNPPFGASINELDLTGVELPVQPLVQIDGDFFPTETKVRRTYFLDIAVSPESGQVYVRIGARRDKEVEVGRRMG